MLHSVCVRVCVCDYTNIYIDTYNRPLLTRPQNQSSCKSDEFKD